MSSSESLVLASPPLPARALARPSVLAWPRLRGLLMLGICAFPALLLYSLGTSRQGAAHGRSSAVVARVRVGRAPADFLLVRSPQPPPVSPKPVSAPVR
jgi:hypothetical protein